MGRKEEVFLAPPPCNNQCKGKRKWK